MFHQRTTDAARGKWRGILMEIGVPDSFLTGRHGPCPFCGGKDRFRFIDKGGSGSWVCNQCRPETGTGTDFVIEHTGLLYPDAAARVDAIVGNLTPDTVARKPEMSDAERRNLLRALWTESKPPEDGDLVTRYLGSRGLIAETAELRFAERIRDGMGGFRPAMVARVLNADGSRVATLHRTFLREDGLGQAEMPSPKKLAPGPVPDGSAIRLGPPNSVLGIAEGIETALAASMLFELSVWAAISTAGMRSWVPPEGVEEVCVFADNDESFAGQAAAYALAHRLHRSVEMVSVKVPPVVGQDWNDVLLAKNGSAA